MRLQKRLALCGVKYLWRYLSYVAYLYILFIYINRTNIVVFKVSVFVVVVLSQMHFFIFFHFIYMVVPGGIGAKFKYVWYLRVDE